MNRIRCIALIVGWGFLAGAVPAAGSTARFIPIELPPGSKAADSLVGVSSDGLIVGGLAENGSNRRAYRWTETNGTILLGLPAANYKLEYLGDVSADGSAFVGHASGPSPFQGSAFRWTEAGGYQFLGTLSNDSFDRSYADGVSADGSVVVGHSQTPNGDRAFRWTQQSGMVSLGNPSTGNPFYPPGSVATDVSANGNAIVGYTSVSGQDDPKAFRWTQATGMQILPGLPTLPGQLPNNGATATSADGSVVAGYSNNHSAHFVWSAQGSVKQLPHVSGAVGANVTEVSDDGSVILGNTLFFDAQSIYIAHASVWIKQQDGYAPMLISSLLSQAGVDVSGWRFKFASNISADNRTIVGVGVNPQGIDQPWVVVLVPEPNSLLLAAAAVGGVLLVCSRKNRWGFKARQLAGRR